MMDEERPISLDGGGGDGAAPRANQAAGVVNDAK